MAIDSIARAQAGVRYDDAARGALEAGSGRGNPLLERGTLSPVERLRLLEGYETVLSGVYTHLPLKRARYGIDPIQRLRILRSQLDELSDDQLHAELSDVLARLRDAHTVYVGPSSLAGKVAVLPFMVEMVGSINAPTYLVTKVSGDLGTSFVPGVELEYWNGVPIDRAVVRHGDREVGGRPDSLRAWAVQSLTLRALQYGPPPDELWVVIGYRSGREQHEIKIPWRIVDPSSIAPDEATATTPARGATLRRTRAVDPAAEAMRRAKMLLYAPASLAKQTSASAAASAPAAAPRAAGDTIDTSIPETIKVGRIDAPGGPYGYLRIWAFDTEPDAFIDELERVIELLPSAGLIIDIRANPGGYIVAAEKALQLFTPKPIEPTRFSVLANELTRQMAHARGLAFDLAPWQASLNAAVRNGELYAQPLPITDRDDANSIGQRYGGPVVLVADARTYSAGDLFAAGFVDNEIGPFLCVGSATGAGGANVWDYDEMRAALRGSPIKLPPLPEGIGLSLSFRRATRARHAEGIPIEDVGIAGTPYDMTRRDVLESNRDLLAHCIELLRTMPASALEVSVAADRRSLTVKTSGIDRLDVTVDGQAHPSERLDAAGASVATTIALPARAGAVEVRGYKGRELRQRRLLALNGPRGAARVR